MNKEQLDTLLDGLETRGDLDRLGRDEVSTLLQGLGLSVDQVMKGEDFIDVTSLRTSIEALSRDLERLPLGEGDRLPSLEARTRVESAFEGNPALDVMMDQLIETLKKSGVSSLAELYNAYRSPSSESLEALWGQMKADSRMKDALEFVIEGIPLGTAEKDVKNVEEAELQVRNKTFGHTFKGIDEKQDAHLLIRLLYLKLSKAFSRALVRSVREEPIPLLKGGAVLDDPEAFSRDLELSIDFEEMDFMTYLDGIAHPLGQAQTKDKGAAEGYFRAFEDMEEGIPANFGLVYLSAEQAASLGVEGQTTARSFRYMGRPYSAVPVGLYLSKRAPEQYAKALTNLQGLADANTGNPVGDYYSSLIEYYRFGETSLNSGSDFQRQYSELCYTSERAWVRYVAYATTHGLPTIHIHPFERYATRSTKNHDLALAIVNPNDTGPFLEAKADFLAGAQAFLDRSGISTTSPDMAEGSLAHLRNASIIVVKARLHSAIKGAGAQNVPDERGGKKEGIVTFFDVEASVASNQSFRPGYLTKRDAVGGLAEWYKEKSPNFLEDFKLFVAGHELNHNMFKGGESQAVQGTGDGLPFNMLEEVKASHGIALMFADPDRLKPDELARLRLALPELIATLLVRLHPFYLNNHRNAYYMQEGAVLLDHAIKAGLLEVARYALTADEVEERTLNGEPGTDEFEMIRVHLTDQAIQDFISRCVRFIERVAPIYKTAEFSPDVKNPTIQDLTEFDLSQALTLACYDRDIDRDPSRQEALLAEKAKITPPADSRMNEVALALLRFVDEEQLGQLKTALKSRRGVADTDEAIAPALSSVREEMMSKFPQITH